jgi:hypothetical protein
VREAKVASEPEILIEWFRGLGIAVTRIGLEVGPLSQWLYEGMRDAGSAVELLETRHVRDAFKAMPAQEMRALLTARKLLQTKNHDVEMSLRGVLRGSGLPITLARCRLPVTRRIAPLEPRLAPFQVTYRGASPHSPTPTRDTGPAPAQSVFSPDDKARERP